MTVTFGGDDEPCSQIGEHDFKEDGVVEWDSYRILFLEIVSRN